MTTFIHSFRHLACEEDRNEIAILLVKHGVNIDIVNKEGNTALSLASRGLAARLATMLQIL